MLTPDEKQRVREEEIYRLELREEIEKSRSRSSWDRIWRFLNTSFGLWALSSIFLAGLTAGYAHWQANNAFERQRQISIMKLNEQFAIRLEYALMLLQRGQHEPNPAESGQANGGEARLASAIDTRRNQSIHMTNIFLDDSEETRILPEFKERSTLSLVLELSNLDPDSPEQSAHNDHSKKAVIQRITELMALRDKLTDTGTYKAMSEAERLSALDSVDKQIREIDAM